MLIKIPVLGKAELQFWIRAFKLEDEVQEVVDRLLEKQERKSAFAPMIAEHQAGRITWVFILGACIDSVGLCDGVGAVWLTTGPQHLLDALKVRNDMANDVINTAQEQGKFDEMIEMESKKDV